MNKLQLVLPLFFRLLLGLGVFVVFTYIAVCLFLFFQQTRFIFFPSPDIQTTPEFLNLSYQEVWLPVAASSGKVEQMYGWWIPTAELDAKVLLYLHGNGINIGANLAPAYQFHQLGFSVLLIDYRGYGRSEGSFPTEARVYQDAAVAWNYLVERHQPSQIFLYGHSLGGAIAKRCAQGAIAIDLAVKHPDAAGLIVESSFTSIRQIVDYQGRFSLFPVDLILNQRFDSISKVHSLQMPVLFIHGTADSQVPAVMSQSLYAAAPEPKQLLFVPGAGHNDVVEVGGSQYLQTIQSFVAQVQTRQAKQICQEDGKR